MVTSGSAAEGHPVVLPLSIDPSSLDPGVYAGSLSVQAGESFETVRVELAVSESPGVLSLSQRATEFVAWTGGGGVTASLGLTNEGVVPLSPEVTAETTDGSSWLRARLLSAELPPGASTSLEISASPETLQPGRYTGRLLVRAAGATNSPQMTVIGLTVLPPDAPLPEDAPASAAVLTPGDSRASVVVGGPPGKALAFTTVVTGDDSGWLRITPAEGAVPPGGSLSLTVSADAASRPPGVYRAIAAIGFSNGTVRSIPVELFVPTPATGALTAAAPPCEPASQLVVHVLSPLPDFRLYAGRPVPVRARTESCDGSPASNAEVIAHTGDTNLQLSPESPGIWAGTWIPKAAGDRTRLEVTTVAVEGGLSRRATFRLEGKVTAAANQDPVVAAAVHSASLRPHDPVVPGSWITIFGDYLTLDPAINESAVLPKSLGGIEVLLGDLPLPLYYVAAGQVNAVVPRALTPNSRHQLLVRRHGVPAVPIAVTVAEVQPGLFTLDQQGTGQAAALLAGTASLAGPESPAVRGGLVELYCTGLGPVDDAPEDGMPASLTNLSRVRIPVAVTVGGRDAEVLFAGLAPGAVGLYQINFRVPDDTPPGDEVEIIVSQRNATSNPATIAIR
jgi:uncharacterized protein (TIGR03437 family)